MTILIAMILDAVLGEPKWLWSRIPHPAVLIGNLIGWADRTFNQGDMRRVKGTILTVCLVVGFGLIGWCLSTVFGPIGDCIMAAILLAQRSLTDHVAAVARDLRFSIHAGRKSVAMIVGRDTNDMDTAAISRSAIESAAENLSDGVTAPLFWLIIGGLPGMLAYKAINTADSMIGYKTERHGAFGWASARLDDVVNWVPARLTAIALQIATGHGPNLGKIRRDAQQHRSPNAGWPEAAMAQGLNIALSGPRSYAGHMTDFPYVNASATKTVSAPDIDRAVAVLWRTWCVMFLAVFGVSLWFYLPLMF